MDKKAGAGTRRRRSAVLAQHGSATAELAIALPAVTALLALLLLGASAGMLQIRLEEGARAGARALARGDSQAQVAEIVARVAGDGATVSVGTDGGFATVSVQGRVGGVLSGFVPWEQVARASTRSEHPSGSANRADGTQHSPGMDAAPVRTPRFPASRTGSLGADPAPESDRRGHG